MRCLEVVKMSKPILAAVGISGLLPQQEQVD